MKSILIKIALIINLFLIYNCKAQTISDYINFYNNVVPKLNSIVPIKTPFYGQNFTNFNSEMLNKNISPELWLCGNKISESNKYYVLTLTFCSVNMLNISLDNSFQYPSVIITFENEIPPQVKNLISETHGEWTYNVQQFFSNMKIEKIEFTGVKGYDSDDYSE
jgi:hypothetical protein